MQERAVIAWMSINGKFEALGALLIVFLAGLFDALVLKKKDWACAIWFVGLAGLATWIASGATTVRICAGIVALVSGLAVLIVYYRAKPMSS